MSKKLMIALVSTVAMAGLAGCERPEEERVDEYYEQREENLDQQHEQQKQQLEQEEEQTEQRMK